MQLLYALSVAFLAGKSTLAIPSNLDASLFARSTGDACSADEGTGSCQSTSSCNGISYTEALCPNDPDDIQCCVTIPCSSSMGAGYCRSVSNNGCDGGSFDPGDLCPGSQDIQCCVAGATGDSGSTDSGDSGDDSGSGTSCSSQGIAGTCRSVSSEGCDGGSFDPANLCPGSQDIQCCVPSTSSGDDSGSGTSCTSQGVAGICRSVSSEGCDGGSFDPANLCPGSQDIQCCVVSYDPIPEAPAPEADPCTADAMDNLEFDVSIDSFEDARNALSPSCFDWSSDNCSDSPDSPDGFEFIPYCQRHDFGYRNSKKLGRCDEDYRNRVDDRLHDGLYDYCNGFSGWESYKGVECRRIADIYYAAVRNLGSC